MIQRSIAYVVCNVPRIAGDSDVLEESGVQGKHSAPLLGVIQGSAVGPAGGAHVERLLHVLAIQVLIQLQSK